MNVTYYSVCGKDNSLRAVISLQLGPSLDTVRLLTGRHRKGCWKEKLE